MARVHFLHETTLDPAAKWPLYLQWCRFELDEQGTLFGYRFIYRRETGELQGARGQARLPSLNVAQALMAKARSEGWGNRDGDQLLAAAKRLQAAGFVVNLVTGFVGAPGANSIQLSPDMMDDAKLVASWT